MVGVANRRCQALRGSSSSSDSSSSSSLFSALIFSYIREFRPKHALLLVHLLNEAYIFQIYTYIRWQNIYYLSHSNPCPKTPANITSYRTCKRSDCVVPHCLQNIYRVIFTTTAKIDTIQKSSRI